MRFDTQNKDMQNNDNQFIGFSIKLFSQNTGNGISDHQDFKFFGGKTPRSSSGTPNQCSHDSLVFKKYSSFTYSKSWTVCWSITNEGYAHTNLRTCIKSLSCGNDVLHFSCLYSVGDTHKYVNICFTFFKTICLKKEIIMTEGYAKLHDNI